METIFLDDETPLTEAEAREQFGNDAINELFESERATVQVGEFRLSIVLPHQDEGD